MYKSETIVSQKCFPRPHSGSLLSLVICLFLNITHADVCVNVFSVSRVTITYLQS